MYARLLLVVLMGATLQAQVTTGSVSGFVLDPSGAPIPRASLKLVSADGSLKRTLVCDAGGFYRAADLPPSRYVVSAEANALGRESLPLVIEVDAKVRLDVT